MDICIKMWVFLKYIFFLFILYTYISIYIYVRNLPPNKRKPQLFMESNFFLTQNKEILTMCRILLLYHPWLKIHLFLGRELYCILYMALTQPAWEKETNSVL